MNVTKISRFIEKFAQDINSPDIRFEPVSIPEAKCAVEIIKRWKPGFFVGVSKIVISSSSNYGFVASTDPTVIHLNADRIKQEFSGRQAVLSLAETIVHERAHVQDYDEESGFSGGEGVAQSAENDFRNWIKNNLKVIEQIPSFKNFS
jgi:hypothetical protein